MAIALTDLLDEKQVILGLRSRKAPNALREIIELLAQNGKIQNPKAFFNGAGTRGGSSQRSRKRRRISPCANGFG